MRLGHLTPADISQSRNLPNDPVTASTEPTVDDPCCIFDAGLTLDEADAFITMTEEALEHAYTLALLTGECGR